MEFGSFEQGQKLLTDHDEQVTLAQEEMSDEAKREFERLQRQHEEKLEQEPTVIVKELIRRKLIAYTDTPNDTTINLPLKDDGEAGIKSDLVLDVSKEVAITGDIRKAKISVAIKENDDSHATQHYIATLETLEPRGKEDFRVYYRPADKSDAHSTRTREVTDDEYDLLKAAIYEAAEVEGIEVLPKVFTTEEIAA